MGMVFLYLELLILLLNFVICCWEKKKKYRRHNMKHNNDLFTVPLFRIIPDLAQSTFLCGLRDANTSRKQEFLEKALKLKDSTKGTIMLSSFAATGNEEDLYHLLDKFFKEDLHFDRLGVQEAIFESIVVKNPVGVDSILDYLSDNNDEKKMFDDL